MPRAAHALADDETFGERPMIMRAMRADGEDLVTASHQQHLLVTDMAQELAIDEILDCDTLREVRPARCFSLFRHSAASPDLSEISPAAGLSGQLQSSATVRLNPRERRAGEQTKHRLFSPACGRG